MAVNEKMEEIREKHLETIDRKKRRVGLGVPILYHYDHVMIN